MSFELLSETFSFIFDSVGYEGIINSPLPVPRKTINRIIERGGNFDYCNSDEAYKQGAEIAEIILGKIRK